MKKLSKKETEKYLYEFFCNLKEKTPQEVRKMLKIAMTHNIKLKEKRKLFCKKCYSVFNAQNSKVRIKKGMKIIECLNCNSLLRWRLKTS